MSESRPEPTALAAVLWDAAADYRDLRHELARHGGAMSDRITGSTEGQLPVDVAVFDTLWDADRFAAHYVHVLYDETTDWVPPSSGGTPVMLEALAWRIGHFTAHPDSEVAHHFVKELMGDTEEGVAGIAHRLASKSRPSGVRPLALGVECAEEGCEGEYRVIVSLFPDADEPEAVTIERIKNKDAWCSKHRHHVMRIGLMSQVARWETLAEVARAAA